MAMLGAACSVCCESNCFPSHKSYGCNFPAGTILRAEVTGVVGDGSNSGWGETDQPYAINGTYCLRNYDNARCIFDSWDCPCTHTAAREFNLGQVQRPSLRIQFCHDPTGLASCPFSLLVPKIGVWFQVPKGRNAAFGVTTGTDFAQRALQVNMSAKPLACSDLLGNTTVTLANAYANTNWADKCGAGTFQPYGFGALSIDLTLDSTCTDNLDPVPCAWWCNGRGFADNMTRSVPSQIKAVITNSNSATLTNGTYYLDWDQAGQKSVPGNLLGSTDGIDKYVYGTAAKYIGVIVSRSAINLDALNRPYVNHGCEAPPGDDFYWHVFQNGVLRDDGMAYTMSISDTAPSCDVPTQSGSISNSAGKSLDIEISAV